MSIREKFVDQFGEDEAQRVEAAANEHKNGIHDSPGSDSFKWALCICLGAKCLNKSAEYHGIVTPWAKLDQWIKDHGELASHDGDFDYLAMLSGVYNRYTGN